MEALTASSVEAGAEPRFPNFFSFLFQSITFISFLWCPSQFRPSFDSAMAKPLWVDKGHPLLIPTFFKVIFVMTVGAR